MKNAQVYITGILLIISQVMPAQVKMLGSEGTVSANEMAVDRKDHIYSTGHFEQQLIAGNQKLQSEGNMDVFIASMTPGMDLRWIKAIGNEGDEMANALYTMDDGLSYVLMTYENNTKIGNQMLKTSGPSDVAIVAFSPNGAIAEVQDFNIKGDPRGDDLVVDPHGNRYILLSFETPITIRGQTYKPAGPEKHGRLLLKMDQDGNILWLKSLKGIKPQSRALLHMGPDDNLYLAGTFTTVLNLDGTTQVANGRSDAFIAKLEPHGQMVWLRRSRGEGMEAARDIGVSPDGSIYLTGYYTQGVVFEDKLETAVAGEDIFLVKYACEGGVRWLRTASGGFEDDESSNLIVADDNTIYLTGNYTQSITFYDKSLGGAEGREVFVASYSADGMVGTLKRAGGRGSDRGLDVEVLTDKSLVTLGEFSGTATFGDQSLKSIGNTDVYLWKF